MPSYVIRKDNHIIDSVTGSKYQYRGDNDKNFAVIVKSGHCEDKRYFIPIVRGVRAKDMESAAYFIRQTARVKRHHKDCIIDACEISRLEDMLIHEINERDPYFIAKSYEQSDKDDTIRRQIVDERYAGEMAYVKTADDCVVERYCAPRYYGNKMVYPHNINMREMLDDFFRIGVQKYGINGGYLTVLCLYYQIYGKKNDLGIKYNQERGVIGYIDSHGEKHARRLPEDHRRYMDEYEDAQKIIEEQRREEERKRAEEDRLFVSSRPSKMDRFKTRLAKTAEIQSGKADETSEESEK